jgi:hypothetical protein
MTTATAPRSTDTAQHDQMRDDLMSGRYFARRAGIARTNEHSGYRTPITARQYGQVIQAIGRMAADHDQLAQAASIIIAKPINPYGNAFQAQARLFEQAADVVGQDFDDVLARTSPEPVRYSQARKPWTFAARVSLAIWLEEISAPLASHLGSMPGVGWVLSDLAAECGVSIDGRHTNLMAARR